MTPKEVKKNYPMVRLKNDDLAIEQVDGACIFAMEAVEGLKAAIGDDRIAEDKAVTLDIHKRTVTFESGKVVTYGALVLACGSWTNELLHNSYLGLMNYLASAEQFTYYEPKKGEELGNYETGKVPILLTVESRPNFEDMELGVYCLPAMEGGIDAVKVGHHQNGQIIRSAEHILPLKAQLPRLPLTRSHETIPGVPVEKDALLESATNGFIQQYLPGLQGDHACSYGRCIYQLSYMKDYDFIIGNHWDSPDGRVQVATGFSGEGFKFAPVIDGIPYEKDYQLISA
ncbi:hypothetical protein FOL47_011315 [Perkinsus chesapeaki]|uniref:FAD dependent oxidoreductase domain-containing protein n=1 Tax=Perkinsus chesapeaki TaxID=330153 RepID=A0A7J6KYJ0_PERCH|nr:hypothetical protein FOL47_011315 [Perkinsus chesapeaki]